MAPGAARPSPSERTTLRSVPGVPGATVRLDEEGFMDIREPAMEDTRTSGAIGEQTNVNVRRKFRS